MNLFNEQKRQESQIDRMKDEVSRANKAMDKMRDKMVRLRSNDAMRSPTSRSIMSPTLIMKNPLQESARPSLLIFDQC